MQQQQPRRGRLQQLLLLLATGASSIGAATAVTAGPENALFARASAELGRFYNIPSSSWVSTESVYEAESLPKSS